MQEKVSNSDTMNPTTNAPGKDPYRGRDPRELPAYTTFEAARYLRIPERTLFAWSFGRNCRVGGGQRRTQSPLIRVASKDKHLLSFTNIAELHVLDALRRIHRIRMPKIRRTVLYLGREFRTEHPLIHQEMWTDGLNLFVDYYGNLLNVSREGQLAMRQLVEAHLQRIDRDATGVVRLFPLTRKRPATVERMATEPRVITMDPRVAFGRPTIVGSRIPTSEIAERFKAGDSFTDLADDFKRPIEEIEEAVRIELDLDAA